MARTSTSFRAGELSPGQIAALEARERIRQIRAGLQGGHITLDQLLLPFGTNDLVAQAERLHIERLLVWVPGIGPRTVELILSELRIATASRVSTLTSKQREAVVHAVAALAPNRSTT